MLDETHVSGAEVVKTKLSDLPKFFLAALPLICIFDAPANLD